MRVLLLIFSLLFAFLFLGCQSKSDTKVSDTSSVVSIEILPKSVLMTSLDQTVPFVATAYDKEGKVVMEDISWSSSDTTVIDITSDGNATAQGVIGSSSIVAKIGNIESNAVVIPVVELVGGAVVVKDSQIVGDIEVLNPNEPMGIGTVYKVKLDGITPLQSGDIVVGDGELPIAGQVIDIETNSSLMNVTLEVVSIDKIFAQLEIHENIDLSNVTPEVAKSIQNYYTLSEQRSGSYLLTLKDEHKDAPALSTSGISRAAEFDLGPLGCTYDGNLSILSLALPVTHQITQNLHFETDFSLSTARIKAAVVGDLKTEFKVNPVITSNLVGKVGCGMELVVLPVPIGGAISWFFGFYVPLGIGFDIGGQLELAQLAYEYKSVTQYDVAFGFDCSGGICTGINTLENKDSQESAQWILPNNSFANNLHLKPEVAGYGYAKLTAGLRTREFELLEAKGGLSQSADLALIAAQIENNNYSSDYKLSFFVSIGSGDDINTFLSNFSSGVLAGLEYKISSDLATSPKALSFTADADHYDIADAVTFKVKLDNNTTEYSLLGYNIDKVSIYQRKINTNGDYEYNWFFDMSASNGQTEFEREWVFTEEGEVKDNFYAFVESKALPIFGEFGKLELAKVKVPEEVGDLIYLNVDYASLIISLNSINDDGTERKELFSSEKTLGSGYTTTISKDGNKIAGSTYDEIIWIDIKDMTEHRLAIPTRQFQWLPDSEHFLVSFYDNGMKYKKYDLNGSLIESYPVDTSDSDKGMSISPDGTKAIYNAQESTPNFTRNYIKALDMQTGATSTLVYDSVLNTIDATYSPDGTKVLMLCAGDYNSETPNDKLCIANADGSNLTIIYELGEKQNMHTGATRSFSPNSKKIFFLYQENYSDPYDITATINNLCTIDIDGTNLACHQTPLKNFIIPRAKDMWSDDSQKIVFTEDSQIVVADANTTTVLSKIDVNASYLYYVGYHP